MLGAALFAANMSSSFKLRKFGMADISMYGVQLQVNEIHEGAPPPGKIQPVPDAKAAADGKASSEVEALAEGPGASEVGANNLMSK